MLIDAAAARHGMTRTEYIRQAALEQLKRDLETKKDNN